MRRLANGPRLEPRGNAFLTSETHRVQRVIVEKTSERDTTPTIMSPASKGRSYSRILDTVARLTAFAEFSVRSIFHSLVRQTSENASCMVLEFSSHEPLRLDERYAAFKNEREQRTPRWKKSLLLSTCPWTNIDSENGYTNLRWVSGVRSGQG